MSDTYDYDEILQLKTAWYYYMEGLTQQEIGQRLGIPRLRVNRLIDRARKTGMVQFSIRSGHTTRLEAKGNSSKPSTFVTHSLPRLQSKQRKQTRMSRLLRRDISMTRWANRIS